MYKNLYIYTYICIYIYFIYICKRNKSCNICAIYVLYTIYMHEVICWKVVGHLIFLVFLKTVIVEFKCVFRGSKPVEALQEGKQIADCIFHKSVYPRL